MNIYMIVTNIRLNLDFHSPRLHIDRMILKNYFLAAFEIFNYFISILSIDIYQNVNIYIKHIEVNLFSKNTYNLRFVHFTYLGKKIFSIVGIVFNLPCIKKISFPNSSRDLP